MGKALWEGCYLPVYKGGLWGADSSYGVHTGELAYIAHTVCGAVMSFPYSLGEYPDYAENFEQVLGALVRNPEKFTVRGFEYRYSEQELHFLKTLQVSLLKIKAEDRPLTPEELRANRNE